MKAKTIYPETTIESKLRWKVEDLRFKLDNARRVAEIWRQIAIAGQSVAIYRYCENGKKLSDVFERIKKSMEKK